MKLIDLNTLNGISGNLLKKLNRNKSIFLTSEFIEDIQNYNQIEELISEINDFCESNLVIGYHYTNANPNEIITKGLLSRNGEQIRNDFLNNYGYLFTHNELESMKNIWKEYFDSFHQEMRDNRIFFNFTLDAFPNKGAEELLANFGGEQTYFSINHIENIRLKLNNIGSPLVVKAKLNPKNITTYSDRTWGKIAVSIYHKMQNSEALIFDVDGHQSIPVLPENIESVVIV